MCYRRWAESEKLTPKPDPAPKTKTQDPVSPQILDSGSGSMLISAMLLHTFYIHHTIHTKSRSGFFPKIQIRIRQHGHVKATAATCADMQHIDIYDLPLTRLGWNRFYRLTIKAV